MAEDIRDWLEAHGLGKYAPTFIDNEIDLDTARDLTEADLRELGIAMGSRKKLLRAIGALQGKDTPDHLVSRDAEAQPDGERRQVTVLFADIAGYTALSRKMDAEKIHALLALVFDKMDAIIREFGGSVDKHIGDSVMAVFGAPIAHGNDAERAARAAMAIHETMPYLSRKAGHPIQIHIGIASGQVVASGVGNSSHYTVTGDSVNLASRLTDRAGPGETFISANVQRAVSNLCDTEELGTLTLKGISDPIPVFRLTRLLPSRGSGQARPIVGRQAEVNQLAGILSACADTGSGQVVYIRGEAGIGKTRLTEEFERLARVAGFESHRVLILDFGVGKGQDAIRSLIRSILSVPTQIGRKLPGAVAEWAVAEGLIDQSQIVFLNDLLDLPQSREMQSIYDAMDNSARNRGKRDTIASLVKNCCTSRRLFLVVEDVQWANDIIMEHLANLARTVTDLPALLVMSSRIEGDRWDSRWRASISSTPFLTLDLTPLRRADAMAFAAEFFDAANQFAISCVERAEGNPLFLEQLLRGAEAAAEGKVPGSVQSIVQARMDVLDPGDKLALQAASVLGQRFELDALSHLVEDEDYDCVKLVEKYLVRPDGDQYLFAHALIREGVYNSLLSSTKNRLHQSAADWFRNHDLRLCAEHLDRAGDPAAARTYLEAAKAEAEKLHFETVLELARRGAELANEKDDICDVYLLQGETLLNTGATDKAIDAYKTAIEHAGDDRRQVSAWSGLAAAYRVADRQDDALEALDMAEARARPKELNAELAYIHYLRGNVYFPLGRIDDCLKEHQASLELAREVGSTKAEAQALSGLGDALYLQGQMQTACERFKKCVELCQNNGYGRIEVANRHMIGWTRIYLMEFRDALQDAVAAQKLASEVSHRRAEVISSELAGFIELRLGDLESASNHLKYAIAVATKIGAGNFLAQGYLLLAKVHFHNGDIQKARAVAQQALDVVRKVGMTFIGPSVLAFHATLCEDPSRRRQALEEAEAILDSGCVAHNQFWFAEAAIDDALQREEWQDALRFADRLETYTRQQPLPWSDFMIERARALSEWGRGERGEQLKQRLANLRRQADESGLVLALPAFDEALAA